MDVEVTKAVQRWHAERLTVSMTADEARELLADLCPGTNAEGQLVSALKFALSMKGQSAHGQEPTSCY